MFVIYSRLLARIVAENVPEGATAQELEKFDVDAEDVQIEMPVSLQATITCVDYNTLTADHNLKEYVEEAVRQAVIEQAQCSISEGDISLELEKGSVVATIKIRGRPEDQSLIAEHFLENPSALSEKLTTKVQAVPQISEVCDDTQLKVVSNVEWPQPGPLTDDPLVRIEFVFTALEHDDLSTAQKQAMVDIMIWSLRPVLMANNFPVTHVEADVLPDGDRTRIVIIAHFRSDQTIDVPNQFLDKPVQGFKNLLSGIPGLEGKVFDQENLQVQIQGHSPCSEFDCPSNYLYKANYQELSGKDRFTCCTEACSLYSCPGNFTLNHDNPEEIRGNDVETCCADACSGFDCPANYNLKDDSKSIRGADTETCCDRVCSSVQCQNSTGYAQKLNSGMIVLSDGDDELDTCCEKTCGIYDCNGYYLPKPNSATIIGDDGDACCDKACSAYACPPNSLNKLDAASITGTDNAACCDVVCSALGKCPDNYGPKARWEEIRRSDPQACCDPLCTIFDCPEGYTDKQDRNTTYGDTVSACCDKTCEIYDCAKNNAYKIIKDDAANILGNDDTACCDDQCVVTLNGNCPDDAFGGCYDECSAGGVSCEERDGPGYVPSKNSKVCCTAGKKFGSEGECEKCAEGKYAASSQTCEYCEDGYILLPQQDGCEQCPAGRSKRDNTTCSECEAGHYSLRGSNACTFCEAGTYALAGSKQCSTCEGGYVPMDDRSACASCAAGRFAKVGSSDCTKCEAGKFAGEAQSSCEFCPSGQIPSDDQDSCVNCSAGRSTKGEMGQSSCTKCELGKYAPEGSFKCLKCSDGYAPSIDQYSCEICPIGRYAESGDKQCRGCAPGKHAAEGSSECENCPAGAVPSTLFVAPERFLSDQTLEDRPGACEECEGGKFAQPGDPSCTPCEAGKYSTAGSGTCEECADGQVPSPRQDSCVDCPGGKSAVSGYSVCITCIAGKFAPNKSKTCEICDDTQYSEEGWANCKPCQGGEIPRKERQGALYLNVACKKCDGGTFSKAGAKECTPCQPDIEFAPEGSEQCYSCPAGNILNCDQSACNPCSAGRFAEVGATTCERCEEGKFSLEGSDTCTDCRLGTVPNAGRSDCYNCSAGEYRGTGDLVCLRCVEGKISGPGQAECSDCSQGEEPSSDRSKCDKCEAGKKGEDGKRCQQCEPGRYSEAGRAECDNCSKGQQPAEDQDRCDECGIGRYSDYGDSCKPCAEGTFAPASSANCSRCSFDAVPTQDGGACVQCNYEDGLYAVPGDAVCSKCQNNEFSNHRGGCTCKYDWIRNADDMCEPCPDGAVCADSRVQNASAGYWIAPYHATYDPPLPCPFGETSCKGNNQCEEGYEGEGCSQCVYSEDNEAKRYAPVAAECRKCEASNSALFVIIPYFVFLLGLTAWPWLLAWLKARHERQENADLQEEATGIGELDLGDTSDVEVAGKGKSTGSIGGLGDSNVGKVLILFGCLKQKIKPFLLMTQVVSCWTAGYYLKYPFILQATSLGEFHSIMKWYERVARFFAFDLFTAVGTLKCAVSALDEFLMIICGFVGLFVFLGASSKLAVCIFGKKTILRTDQLFAPSFLIWTYLLYATLCSKIVQFIPIEDATFDCSFRNMIGCRLRADYRVSMTSPEYLSLGMVSVFSSIGLIVVGIPALYMVAMLKHRKNIDIGRKVHETDVQWVKRRNDGASLDESTMAFKELFISLKPNRWYFEVLNLMRQFFLNFFLIMLDISARSHILLSIFLLISHGLLIYVLDPYVDGMENRSHYFCSTALVAMMSGQLALLSLIEGADLTGEENNANEALFIAYAFGVIFASVASYTIYATFNAAEEVLGENAAQMLEETQRKSTERIEEKLKSYVEEMEIEYDIIKPIAEAELRKIDNVKMLKTKLKNIQDDPRAFIDEMVEALDKARDQLKLFDVEGESAPADIHMDMAALAGCRDLVGEGNGGLLLSNLMHTGHTGEVAILLGEHDHRFIELHAKVMELTKQGDAMSFVTLRDVSDKNIWMRKDSLGNIPLHYATSIDIIKVLVEKEPRATTAQNNAGETPFGYMSRTGVPFNVAKTVVLNMEALKVGGEEQQSSSTGFFARVQKCFAGCRRKKKALSLEQEEAENTLTRELVQELLTEDKDGICPAMRYGAELPCPLEIAAIFKALPKWNAVRARIDSSFRLLENLQELEKEVKDSILGAASMEPLKIVLHLSCFGESKVWNKHVHTQQSSDRLKVVGKCLIRLLRDYEILGRQGVDTAELSTMIRKLLRATRGVRGPFFDPRRPYARELQTMLQQITSNTKEELANESEKLATTLTGQIEDFRLNVPPSYVSRLLPHETRETDGLTLRCDFESQWPHAAWVGRRDLARAFSELKAYNLLGDRANADIQFAKVCGEETHGLSALDSKIMRCDAHARHFIRMQHGNEIEKHFEGVCQSLGLDARSVLKTEYRGMQHVLTQVDEILEAMRGLQIIHHAKYQTSLLQELEETIIVEDGEVFTKYEKYLGELVTAGDFVVDVNTVSFVLQDEVDLLMLYETLINKTWEYDGLRMLRLENSFSANYDTDDSEGYRQMKMWIAVDPSRITPQSASFPVMTEVHIHLKAFYDRKNLLMELPMEMDRGDFDWHHVQEIRYKDATEEIPKSERLTKHYGETMTEIFSILSSTYQREGGTPNMDREARKRELERATAQAMSPAASPSGAQPLTPIRDIPDDQELEKISPRGSARPAVFVCDC